MPDSALAPAADPLAALTRDKPVTLGDLSVLTDRYDELGAWPNLRLASNGRNHKVFAADTIGIKHNLLMEFHGSSNAVYLCEGCELNAVKIIVKGSHCTLAIGPNA